MKAVVSKKDLIKGMKLVGSAVAAHSTIPILGHVKITAEGEKLILTATDLEVSIVCELPAKDVVAGITTLSADRFSSVVGAQAGEEISLNVDDQYATSIVSDTGTFKMLGQSEADFPKVPDITGEILVELEASVLKTALEQAGYCASSDVTRHVLNGVFLKCEKEELSIVATDGKRLAIAKLPGMKEKWELIVPSKTVTALLRSLQDGKVAISRETNLVIFKFAEIRIVSKLIEGTYPNFEQVMPKTVGEHIQINREALLSALKRVSLLTNDKSNSVQLFFSANKLKVSVKTAEVGEAHESLVIDYKGKDISVSFSPDYLMEPLRHLVGETVTIGLTDGMSPGIIEDGSAFRYVLMPMRMN